MKKKSAKRPRKDERHKTRFLPEEQSYEKYGAKLTEQQAAVYDYVRIQILGGNHPTLREIVRRFGYCGPNAAAAKINALARKGLLDVSHGVSRGIRLAEETVVVPVGRGERFRALIFAIQDANDVQIEAMCKIAGV